MRTGHVIDARHEAYRKYRVLDQNDNEVERTAGELADGNSLMMGVELWRKNFGAAIARVRTWCGEVAPQMRAALVDVRSNKVLFYFVPQSARYDLSLGARMTSLEVELGGSAGIGYVESLQVPADSLERFAGPGARVVWMRPGDDLFAPEAVAGTSSSSSSGRVTVTVVGEIN